MEHVTNDKGYIRGEEAPTSEAGRHAIPVKVILGVFAALIALTALTVLASELPLGGAALPLAFGVAIVQAALVLGYFMRLKYDPRFHAVVFFGALSFAALLLAFPCLDGSTRATVNPQWGNDRLIEDKGLNVRPDPVPDEAGAASADSVIEGEPE